MLFVVMSRCFKPKHSIPQALSVSKILGRLQCVPSVCVTVQQISSVYLICLSQFPVMYSCLTQSCSVTNVLCI